MSGCVEVGRDDTAVMVRDSKAPNQAALRYSPKEWQVFIAGVKAGEFDEFAADS